MRGSKVLLFTVLFASLVYGCSIHHFIAADFHNYLNNNQGSSNLHKTGTKGLRYTMDAETRSHSYEFRAANAGYAHVWVVQFGKMLNDYLASTDVQQAFPGLGAAETSTGTNLAFSLKSYKVSGLAVHMDLEIASVKDGKDLFRKVYHSDTDSKSGQVMMTGVWGMKNAVQRSTQEALEDVLGRFIADAEQDHALPPGQ